MLSDEDLAGDGGRARRKNLGSTRLLGLPDVVSEQLELFRWHHRAELPCLESSRAAGALDEELACVNLSGGVAAQAPVPAP